MDKMTMNEKIFSKYRECGQEFRMLGINNYFNYENDNPNDEILKPLCDYFGVPPCYTFNELHKQRDAVTSVNLYYDYGAGFSVTIDKNEKTKEIRFPQNMDDERLANICLSVFEKIIAVAKKRIEMANNITDEMLFDLLECGIKKIYPSDYVIKRMTGKRGCEKYNYQAIVISSSERTIDQVGCATCGKRTNGKFYFSFSDPLCGQQTFEYDTFEEYKKAVTEKLEV